MIDTIGWSLIHSLWQGLGIALALALILRWLSPSKPQTRYVAACLALLGTLAAPAATFLWLRRHALAATAPFRAQLMDRTLPPDLLPAARHFSLDPWLPWITAAWLIGVVLLSGRWIVSWAWLQLRIRSSNPAVVAQLQSRVAALRQQLHVSRDVLIRSADWLASPAVTGWIRPTLLIPTSALTGLAPDQLEALLAHELAHIRRYDYLANLIQTAIETLLFYHPAVWWISARIRTERENCCDDIALSVCTDRLVYASALVALEETRDRAPEMAVAAGGPSLKVRIRRILYNQETAPSGWPAAALVTLVLGLFLWNAPRIAAQSPDLQPRYQQWLNQTVVYIIQPDERAAFLKLATDAERDHFIQQFWDRRNPHPEDPRHNAFKDEHYRRLAYADERFVAPPIPGWRTDRGRIYIVYGPPDEIERDPAEHLEQWRYHHLQGVGDQIVIDFVNGEMTKDPNPGSGRFVPR